MNTHTQTKPANEILVDFTSLNLVEPLMQAVNESGYTKPTPIQAQSIPALLEGHDLLGLAQTGTGKTAAFTLPMLQRLMAHRKQPQPKSMRALILTPTRELAVQINDSIKTYGRHLPLRSTVIFGGVGQVPQVNTLRRGIDLLVATPGRLLDLMNQGHVTLTSVEFFVLDEADRMLDMGFIRDIKKIVSSLPARRQTLLFSATMPNDVADLAQSLLTKPKRVEVVPQSTTAERIDQIVYMVPKSNKRRLLKELLSTPDVTRTIVFTRTKRGADRVAENLQRDGFTSAAIHGNKGQSARQIALNAFRAGSVEVLVATDIAARGIDIDNISHVVNFDLPLEPESYVHRIGRTGRAGATGIAISLCDSEERSLLRDIEKLVRIKLPVVDDHPLAMGGEIESNEQITLQRAQSIRESREMRQARDNGHRRNGPNAKRNGKKPAHTMQPRGEARHQRTHNKHPEQAAELRHDHQHHSERRSARPERQANPERATRNERNQSPTLKGHHKGDSRFGAETQTSTMHHHRRNEQRNATATDRPQRRIDYRARAEQDETAGKPRRHSGERAHRFGKGRARG